MENYYFLVLGMALVTFIPRIIPLIFLRDIKLSPNLQQFLNNIPYAVLGALILPGVFHSTGNIVYSAIGAGTAVLLAYLNLNLLIVVLGSIFSIFLFQMWF